MIQLTPQMKILVAVEAVDGRKGIDSLVADWQQIYGHPIYLLETFIDPSRFGGTCYRAANWRLVGQTTGRGKDDQTHQPNRPIKQILVLPLVKDYRRQLAQ